MLSSRLLDDWGPEKLNDDQRRDVLEIIENRYERRSTIVTSQVRLDRWYEIIGNPTLADAILVRTSGWIKDGEQPFNRYLYDHKDND
jgi:DNA replication protein DnaC